MTITSKLYFPYSLNIFVKSKTLNKCVFQRGSAQTCVCMLKTFPPAGSREVCCPADIRNVLLQIPDVSERRRVCAAMTGEVCQFNARMSRIKAGGGKKWRLPTIEPSVQTSGWTAPRVRVCECELQRISKG